jgi:hypothetical protein
MSTNLWVQLPHTGGKNSFMWITKPMQHLPKYVIKFVGTANPITKFEFGEEYVKNNEQNYFLFLGDIQSQI